MKMPYSQPEYGIFIRCKTLYHFKMFYRLSRQLAAISIWL